MNRISAPLAIAFICSLCFAQSSSNRGQKKFACGKVITTFDKSKNETRAQLRPLILEGVFQVAPGETLLTEGSSANDDHGVALTVFYTYPGKTVTKPTSLILVIESESQNATYDRERNVSFNIDGNSLPLGLMERAAQRTNLGFIREDLSITISVDVFMKITNARKAKIALGANSFTLTDCHLDALRNFASTL